MNALALSVLLAAAPAPAPVRAPVPATSVLATAAMTPGPAAMAITPGQGETAIETLPDLVAEPTGPRAPRGFAGVRVLGGALQLRHVRGAAATAGVAVAFPLASHLELRVEFQTAMRFTWGYLALAPELTYRMLPGAPVSPFLGAGLLAGAVNLRDEALGRPVSVRGAATPRGLSPTTQVMPVLRASGTPTDLPDGGVGGGAPSALAPTFGPIATAGIELRLSPGLGLTLGGRYASVHWKAKQYGGFGAFAGITGSLD